MNKNEKLLELKIDASELTEQQIRQIKTINTLLTHIMTAEYEDEYFNSSTDLFRMIATAIKTSNFNNADSNIPYDQQVLEFCADILSDQVYQDKVVQYDN